MGSGVSSFQTHLKKKHTLKDYIFSTIGNVITKQIKQTGVDLRKVWFEGTKGVIRARYSKNRQYNGQTRKYKIGPPNTTQKSNDSAKRNPD